MFKITFNPHSKMLVCVTTMGASMCNAVRVMFQWQKSLKHVTLEIGIRQVLIMLFQSMSSQ